MNRKIGTWIVSLFLAVALMGCARPELSKGPTGYEEIPPMLSVLTNVAQGAVEKGYSVQGQDSALVYIGKEKPQFIDWFRGHWYQLLIEKVADYAVVMVCDNGKAVFEDTYCKEGFPDKDHRGKNIGCEITMTEEEVEEICR